MPQKYYTVLQISRAIAVSESTVTNWIRSKALKGVFNSSHAYLIKHEDLKAFIDNPPGARARGLIALADRNILEELIGKNEPRKKHHRGGYRASPRPFGWTLP